MKKSLPARAALGAASALTAAGMLTACSSGPYTPPQVLVVSRYTCLNAGIPSYCLTLTGGHRVYVSRTVYSTARAGYVYTTTHYGQYSSGGVVAKRGSSPAPAEMRSNITPAAKTPAPAGSASAKIPGVVAPAKTSAAKMKVTPAAKAPAARVPAAKAPAAKAPAAKAPPVMRAPAPAKPRSYSHP